MNTDFERNARMQEAWDAALEVMKPSQKDLEHGLELHANSIVCETYGFSPYNAVDGDRMKVMAEEGASEKELQDARENMLMTQCVKSSRERAEYQNAWKSTGL